MLPYMKRVLSIVLADGIAFWASFVLLAVARFGAEASEAARAHLLPFAILYAAWTMLFFLFGLYDLFAIKPTVPHMQRFGIALLACLIVGALLFYLVPFFGIAPKTNLLLQAAAFGGVSLGLRRAMFFVFSQQLTRPVILCGTSAYTAELASIIETHPQLGLRLSARAENAARALSAAQDRRNRGGTLVVETNAEALPVSLLQAAYRNDITAIDVAEAYEEFLHKIPIGYIDASWIISHVRLRRSKGIEAAERALSAIAAMAVLIAASPVLIATAIGIYLGDRGPVFYSQTRTGLHGRPFKLLKFRSMIRDSETNGAVWATERDHRITPIGRIIRKLHIDELPQMINVMRGDLALVGPRPERPEFVSELERNIPFYSLRHVIRPGFTGWAQIKYRYARTLEDSKEKFEYDLYYIKNKNAFLDAGIVLKTIQIIFTH